MNIEVFGVLTMQCIQQQIVQYSYDQVIPPCICGFSSYLVESQGNGVSRDGAQNIVPVYVIFSQAFYNILLISFWL